jgi:hypothetical protein
LFSKKNFFFLKKNSDLVYLLASGGQNSVTFLAATRPHSFFAAEPLFFHYASHWIVWLLVVVFWITLVYSDKEVIRVALVTRGILCRFNFFFF